MTELRLVRGDATPEELAAVVALLSSMGGAAPEPEPETPSLWGRPQLRTAVHAGAGVWKASALPR